MLFCKVCQNMMYVGLDEEDRLTNTCRHCGNVEMDDGAQCILTKNYVDDEIKFRQFVNPNIKYDPTLPRVNGIVCVNTACSRPPDRDDEVMYIQYDEKNKKFMYYCCFCEAFWMSGTTTVTFATAQEEEEEEKEGEGEKKNTDVQRA